MIIKKVISIRLDQNKLVAVRTIEDGIISINSLKEKILLFEERFILIINEEEHNFHLDTKTMLFDSPDINILRTANQF